MNETALKTKTMKFIKKTYPGIFVYKSSDRFTTGIPDIIGCLRGRFYAIELKIFPNKPTRLQLYVLDLIKKAGGAADVCYDIEEVKLFMEVLNGK